MAHLLISKGNIYKFQRQLWCAFRAYIDGVAYHLFVLVARMGNMLHGETQTPWYVGNRPARAIERRFNYWARIAADFPEHLLRYNPMTCLTQQVF